MIRVKICGIRSLEEALIAVNAGADALGFVFAPQSKRYIDPVSVREITNKISPFVARAGVFVDSTPDEVENIARISGLTVIQLHGEENPAHYRDLGLPLIKAIKVSLAQGEDPFKGNGGMGEGPDKTVIPADKQEVGIEIGQDFDAKLRAWQGLVQGILIDSAVLGQFGGTGQAVPWSHPEVRNLFSDIKAAGIPLILAGGLYPHNVKEAIEVVRPEAVDVSSGVEADGGKDKNLIQEFMKQVQKAADFSDG